MTPDDRLRAVIEWGTYICEAPDGAGIPRRYIGPTTTLDYEQLGGCACAKCSSPTEQLPGDRFAPHRGIESHRLNVAARRAHLRP